MNTQGLLIGELRDRLGQEGGLRADEDIDHPAQAKTDDGRKHTGLKNRASQE